MPILLELTAAQQIEYARIADELERSGFDSEPFGNRTIAVKGAPAGVGPAEIEKLVFEILEIAEGEPRQSFAGRSAPGHGREHRLPRGHQDQHAAGSNQNGVAAA